MEHMKFEIILGAGQEGLITSDFDGKVKKSENPTRDPARLNRRDQRSKIVRTQII